MCDIKLPATSAPALNHNHLIHQKQLLIGFAAEMMSVVSGQTCADTGHYIIFCLLFQMT